MKKTSLGMLTSLLATTAVAQAANFGGNAVHLILLLAIGLLVYELLAEDAPAT